MHPDLALLEGLGNVASGARLRKTDRQHFLRSIALHISPNSPQSRVKGFGNKAWVCRVVGRAAFEMPLPPRWTEQVDARGFIYFSHALRTETTWDHPLIDAFRETLAFAIDVANTDTSLGEAAASVKDHLCK